MTDFAHLLSALAQHLDTHVVNIHNRRGNELHVQIARAAAPRLAEILRADFAAELILMVASDRRADKGVFEIHYLFANDREDWFVHATNDLLADDPTISSLATFYYPASRFEREI